MIRRCRAPWGGRYLENLSGMQFVIKFLCSGVCRVRPAVVRVVAECRAQLVETQRTELPKLRVPAPWPTLSQMRPTDLADVGIFKVLSAVYADVLVRSLL